MSHLARSFPLFFACLLLSACEPTQPDNPPPERLIVDLLTDPELAVITDSEPEFGWVFPVEGKFQTAYQILVSSSPELLMDYQADVWDSGKVDSTASINVSYGGEPLQPHTAYYWRVKVWGSNGWESSYSEIQRFNTGDFTGQLDSWPGESQFVELSDSVFVSENRQTAVFQDMRPAEFEMTSAGNYFADFGRAAFATLSFRAHAEADNTLIEVYLGERKNADSSVNKSPGHSKIGFEKVEMRLEQGEHDYQVVFPRHHSNSPHSQKLAPHYPEVLPFRYVEIIGDAAAYEIQSLTQNALYYPFDDNASTFTTDDENLNQVLDLSKYTLKATPFLGLYADGNRERMPYEADAYIQQLGHYSVDREYSIARYTNQFLLHHASWPTEWQMHSIFMAWEDYMATGDTEFIREYYDQLKAKTLIALAREEGLISTRTGKITPDLLASLHYDGESLRDIVDWPAGTPEGQEQKTNAGPHPEGERDGYEFADYNTVVNAFHYQSLLLMAGMAEAIDQNADVDFFAQRAALVKQSFYQAFFDSERGIFVDGEGVTHAALHANVFALAFGLVPAEHLDSVLEFVKSRGMATSVYGAQYLLDGLFDAGEAEYGLELMTAEHRRSWMNMIRVGSTMTTEAWDEYYKPNLTWNHAWGSAPANIAVRQIVGIKPTKPGFEEFRILPQPGGLTEIDMKVPTIRGPIEVDFSDVAGRWTLKINLPGNTSAKLWLPGDFDDIRLDTLPVESSVASSAYGKEYRVVELLPGVSLVEAGIQ